MRRCPTCHGRGEVPSADDLKPCSNDNCNKWFATKDGVFKKHKRLTGVLYCSQSCQSAQNQRDYRRRRKQKAGAA